MCSQLETTVTEIHAWQGQMETRQERMENIVTEIHTRQERMETTLTKMQDRLANKCIDNHSWMSAVIGFPLLLDFVTRSRCQLQGYVSNIQFSFSARQ